MDADADRHAVELAQVYLVDAPDSSGNILCHTDLDKIVGVVATVRYVELQCLQIHTIV